MVIVCEKVVENGAKVVEDVDVEFATVEVVEDIKVSLFETSLPLQNEIKNIISNLDICFMIKLSQNGSLLSKYKSKDFLKTFVGATGFEPVTSSL